MKIVLRLVAAWLGLTSLVAAALVLHFGSDPGVFRTAKGALAALGLLAFAAANGFAAFRLWRLQEMGRRAAIAVNLLTMAFVLIVARAVDADALVRLAVTGGITAMLFLPAARRACA